MFTVIDKTDVWATGIPFELVAEDIVLPKMYHCIKHPDRAVRDSHGILMLLY